MAEAATQATAQPRGSIAQKVFGPVIRRMEFERARLFVNTISSRGTLATEEDMARLGRIGKRYAGLRPSKKAPFFRDPPFKESLLAFNAFLRLAEQEKERGKASDTTLENLMISGYLAAKRLHGRNNRATQHICFREASRAAAVLADRWESTARKQLSNGNPAEALESLHRASTYAWNWERFSGLAFSNNENDRASEAYARINSTIIVVEQVIRALKRPGVNPSP